jgi:hypothetical protein
MQGLFGRFGRKTSPPPTDSSENSRQQRQRSPSELDDRSTANRREWENSTPEERDFPISSFDTDDEETNWDDAETEDNENNPIVPRFDRQVAYAQPIAPVAPPPTKSTTSDLDDWDEALPAATVKNNTIQEARRSKNAPPVSLGEDIWDDDPDTPSASSGTPSGNLNLDPTPPNRVGKKLAPNSLRGFWAGTLAQFRRFLPAPIRQLSDAILTGIVVAIVTVGIWFVDGFFVPSTAPSVAKTPSAPEIVPIPPIAPSPALAPTAPPTATSPALVPAIPASPPIDPDRAFVAAIQTQLTEITSQYPDKIVKSIDVDLARDRLIVRLDPLWYTIDDREQNSLTDRMWLQAQANHFTKLEIQDSQGVSIARSPVVGKHPIILQRRQS